MSKIKTMDGLRQAVAARMASYFSDATAKRIADEWADDFRRKIVQDTYNLLGLDVSWGVARWRGDSPLQLAVKAFAGTHVDRLLEEAKPLLLAQLEKNRAKLNRAVAREFREALDRHLAEAVQGYTRSLIREITETEADALAERIFAEFVKGEPGTSAPTESVTGGEET